MATPFLSPPSARRITAFWLLVAGCLVAGPDRRARAEAPASQPVVHLVLDQSRFDAAVADAVTARRAIHERPEVGLELPETRALVVARLKSYGLIPVELGSGVVAVIDGKGPGPTIGFRGDMDALPIQELPREGKAFVSKIDGRSHSCGHDGHTAMLLGAASYLSQTREFHGRVVLIFQPAEEIGRGALAMIGAGLFEKYPCDAVFALHNGPGQTLGQLGVAAGPTNAGARNFHITVTGGGGHAGTTPGRVRSPLDAATDLATKIRAIALKYQKGLENPSYPCVVRLSVFRTSEAKENVISNKVELAGTARAFSPETYAAIDAELREAVKQVEDLQEGFKFDYSFPDGTPPLRNTEAGVLTVLRAAESAGLPVRGTEPRTGAEDFGRMIRVLIDRDGDKAEGAMTVLYTGPGPGLHTPDYGFNDAAIPFGMKFFISVAQTRLGPTPAR